MTYDPNNILAQIIDGTLPCHKVYEDADTLAFLDIYPRSRGHVLVTPKAPCRTIVDAPLKALSSCMMTAQKISRIMKEALGADGILLIQRNEATAGQVIFHLHFHLIPCYKDQPLIDEGVQNEPDHDAFNLIASQLKQALEKSDH